MEDFTVQNQLRSIMGPTQKPTDRIGRGELGIPSLTPDGKSFGDVLSESISAVNKLQSEANVSLEKLATGENKDVHNTIIQLEKAGLSFKLMMEVRNKLLDAYKEVTKTSV